MRRVIKKQNKQSRHSLLSARLFVFQGNYLIHHNPSAFSESGAIPHRQPIFGILPVPFLFAERLTGCLPQYDSPVKYSPESGLTDIESNGQPGWREAEGLSVMINAACAASSLLKAKVLSFRPQKPQSRSDTSPLPRRRGNVQVLHSMQASPRHCKTLLFRSEYGHAARG